MNLIGGIKNQSLGHLEQACERYATMVYEVLRRRLAIGFRSTKYSYIGDESGRIGRFTATFIPWDQTNEYKHGHRSTKVTFRVEATKGLWKLDDGSVKDLETGMIATIQFTAGAFRRIVLTIPEWDEIRYADGAVQTDEQVFEISSGRKPWGTFYNHIML